MELTHDPHGEVGESRPHLRIGEAGFPPERKSLELAAVEPVKCIHHEDHLQAVLVGQDILVVDVGDTG